MPDSNAEIAEAPEATASDPKNELVSIFNKNPPGGDYVEHIYEAVKDADGRIVRDRVKTEFRAPGRDFSNVPRWLADKWKRMFPGIVVDASAISRGKAAGPADNAVVAGLTAENVELKARLANLEAMVSELQADPTGENPGGRKRKR